MLICYVYVCAWGHDTAGVSLYRYIYVGDISKIYNMRPFVKIM